MTPGHRFLAARSRTCKASLAAALAIALVASATVLVPPSKAAAGVITTYAGGVGQGPANIVAQSPSALAVHGTKLYVLDSTADAVRVIEMMTGEESPFAGGGSDYSGQTGPAASAALRDPQGIAVDGAGNLYVSEAAAHRVRKVDNASGTITTYAGGNGEGFSGDCKLEATAAVETCPATSAQLRRPSGLLFASDSLYIADKDNFRVRRVNAAGNITTAASFNTQPTFGAPQALARDSAGNLFVSVDQRIYKVDAAGAATPYAGSVESGYGGDGGPALAARLSATVRGLAVDASDNLYIADTSNHRVRRVDPSTSTITTYAGTGVAGYGGDCTATVSTCPSTAAQFNEPAAVAFHASDAGTLYVGDLGNHRVRMIGPGPGFATSTIAGTGEPSGDGGPATLAQLNIPSGVAVDTAGNVYIADREDHRVRRVDASGKISTFAGTGVAGYSGDCGGTTATCAASSAQLQAPVGLALDAEGNIYIADQGNHRVRKVAQDGRITTVAGSGTLGFAGDGGPSSEARLSHPTGLAVNQAGDLFIADRNNYRVRRVDRSSAIITTYAGTGVSGYSGDCTDTVTTCPPASAQLGALTSLSFDPTGNLYIADPNYKRVRRISPDGTTISTFAGTGTQGSTGDGGPAMQAKLTFPVGVEADGAGNVFIADQDDHRVRRVDPAGVISAYAGTGTPGFSGDGGNATAAALSYPSAVETDTLGSLFIAEGRRVRRVAGAADVVNITGNGAFGGQLVGAPSEERSFSMLNTGATAVPVTSVAVVGPHAADFVIRADACTGTTLPSGQSCTVGVRFVPGAAGSRSASLRFVYDAPGSPTLVLLGGTGLDLRLSETSGPTFGGTKVVITGAGLDRASGVRFGDRPAFSHRIDGPGQITAVSPPHSRGPVELLVIGTTPGQVLGRATFTYFEGSWSPTAPMAAGRNGHTATRLADGRVLVAGGIPSLDVGRGAGPLSSAELYDPGTGKWTAAAFLHTARSLHTATLLANGRVLVVGGFKAVQRPGQPPVDGSTALAELYDPATNSWTRTASLKAPRGEHTATLLSDGSVLVVGGSCRGEGPVNEMGPLNGEGPLNEGGQEPSVDCAENTVVDAVTIPPPRQSLSSAEVYLPDQGQWVSAGAMTNDHSGHTASLIATGSGQRVLIAGGWHTEVSNGTYYWSTAAAELFDPLTRTWTPTSSLDDCATSTGCAARVGHSASTLPDGRVLVSGGHVGPAYHPDPNRYAEPGLNTSQLYDPKTATWSGAAAMADGRAFHGAVLLEGPDCGSSCGKVLVAGGQGSCFRVVASGNCETYEWVRGAELYDPLSGGWSPAGAMKSKRSDSRMTALSDGMVLLTGGSDHAKRPSTSASEIYRPNAIQPSLFLAGLEPRAGPSSGAEVSLIGAGMFSSTTSIRVGAAEAVVTLVSDTEVVALLPGQAQGIVALEMTTSRGQVETSYTYGPGRWQSTGPLKTGRSLTPALLLNGPSCRAGRPSCGKVVMAGHGRSEMYEPAQGTWEQGPQPAVAVGFDALPAVVLDGPQCRGAGEMHSSCGKVLMYGHPGDGGLSSGEERVRTFLWDPDTGAVSNFADTGALRFEPTFTLLDGPSCQVAVAAPSCGRVLLAGGNTTYGYRPPLASAEVYDPLQHRWDATASMREARSLHTATLLPDGRVLVAGGLAGAELNNTNTVLDSAELYDPGGNGREPSWTTTGKMSVPRFTHTATELIRSPCGQNCGQVLVTGGATTQRSGKDLLFTRSAERYDPTAGTWRPAALLSDQRGGHTATLLSDGTVLVAGRGAAIDEYGPDPISTAEVYDPVTDRWTDTSDMEVARGAHTAVMLDGPLCSSAAPPAHCGRVLIAGGSAGAGSVTDVRPFIMLAEPLDEAEIYIPAPAVHAMLPSGGPEGTQVVITGAGFAPGNTVSFDGVPLPADAVSFDLPTQLTVVSPAHRPGVVGVAVAGDGGTSAHLRPLPPHMFTYSASAVPGQVIDLVATAVSETEVDLVFPAPADDSRFPTDGPPATRFVVKQSTAPIVDEAAFNAATSLCGGECSQFVPGSIGTPLYLRVTDLEPGTTYHFALQAVNDIGAGPISKPASVTLASTGVCQAIEAAAGQVVYRGGRYHLVGGPDGTVVRSDSPLYSWSDQGAGETYASGAGGEPLSSGRGYWSYSRCDRAVSPAGEGTDHASFDLGAYHASMVANPSGTGPASLTGHDFSARWDPDLNAGAGGYRISAYREPQSLAVGEGIWAFSFVPTTLSIRR